MTTTSATSVPVATHRRLPAPELVIALGAFAALCLAVLLRSTALLEPDDYAYRASIVALTHGHISLTNAQYTALAAQLGSIAQWVQLPSGSPGGPGGAGGGFPGGGPPSGQVPGGAPPAGGLPGGAPPSGTAPPSGSAPPPGSAPPSGTQTPSTPA